MKLPKGFGGQGFGSMLQQAQAAMAKAQEVEIALANERVEVEKGPIKATFSGVGELLKVKLDPSVVDPNDIEALEDLIVGVIKDGFTRTTELRNSRVQAIMPNIPGLG